MSNVATRNANKPQPVVQDSRDLPKGAQEAIHRGRWAPIDRNPRSNDNQHQDIAMPPRAGEIAVALEALHNAVDNLEYCGGELLKRIEPIIANVPAESTGFQSEEFSAPLACSIQAYIKRINVLAGMIGEATRKIEL